MKNFKFLDIIIIFCLATALIVGFFTYKNLRQTADKQIEKTSKIEFKVFLRGVTITSGINPINKNDETFISIRNVPYTNLKITDTTINSKKTVVATSKGFKVINDASQKSMYDIVVTVTDIAKITKDGAVVGGNKIKIGLPITLEGKDYKFNGTVSDIKVFSDN